MIQKSWRAANVSLSVSYSVRSAKSILTYRRKLIKAGTDATPRIVDTKLKRHPWHSQHEALLDVAVADARDAEER